MKVTIEYLLSEAGRKAAIALGINAKREQTISLDDPANTLLERASVDSLGNARISIARSVRRLAVSHKYFDGNVPFDILGEPENDYPSLELDSPIVSLAGAVAAIARYDSQDAELLAGRPARQAKIDADFEARKAAYLENKAQRLREQAEERAKDAEAARVREATAATDREANSKRVIRVPLTDGSGRWFDSNKATKFAESTEWNGNNHISVATGSQWEHEALYRTASCRYVINCWSNYQGSRETYEEISHEAAARWLVENGEEDPECVAEQVAALEIK